jgi:RNA polymerase sigma-70 factor, ECF subfamily
LKGFSRAADDPTTRSPGSDEPSFDEVYEAHCPFVWRCLRALGVAETALDDAVQDVFLVVHRQLAGFRGQSTLRTWLFGILRKVAYNHRRASHRQVVRRENLVRQSPPASSGPLESAQDAEAAAFVQKFLAGLDDRKRGVFILSMLEEMSMPEVATALAIPLNTAYTRLRRARADFQRALDERRGHHERG